MPVPASTAPAQDLRKPPAISAPTGYVAPGGAAARADVVGVRIGMTVDQAVRALKAHNDQMTFDNLRVTIDRLVTEPYIFAVVARNHDNAHEVKGDLFEEVVLRLALPPNPAVVTEILRVLSGRKGKNLSTDVVVAGLKDKYGGGFTRIRVGSLEDLYVWRLDGLPVEVKQGGCFYQGAPVNPTRRWSAMKQFANDELHTRTLAGNVRIAELCGVVVAAVLQYDARNEKVVTTLSVRASSEPFRVDMQRRSLEHLISLDERRKEAESQRMNGQKPKL